MSFHFTAQNTIGAIHIVNGRGYFDAATRDLNIDRLDAVEVLRTPEPARLQHGPAESKLGGRLSSRDLKAPELEERALRLAKAERFLTQPIKRFPAEEQAARETEDDG